jgi:hypothetical protein
MQSMRYIFLALFIVFTSVSCVDIIDDISFKNDGSGTFKYTVNLSSSKVKVNSILSLDTLNGKKVPHIPEIKEKIEFYKNLLEKKEGIENVKIDANFTDFILKFQCDFSSIYILQKAFREIAKEEFYKSSELRDKEIETNWLQFEKNKLIRTVPSISTEILSRIKKEDLESLKKANYISITRFEKTIEKVENPLSVINPNKLAVMLKTSPYSLIQNLKLLENTIYLSETKKTQ